MIGATPELTGAMLIAFTYTKSDPAEAMIPLVSIDVGSISGGDFSHDKPVGWG